MRAQVTGSAHQLQNHIWSSRFYKPTAAGGNEEPLFSLPGRPNLELQGYSEATASPIPEQLQEVRVYGRGGDTRVLLARAQFSTRSEGRLLALRDLMAPHLDVFMKSLDAGLSAVSWRFTCSAWGCEASHDIPDTFARSSGAMLGPPVAALVTEAWVSDGPGELSWFESWTDVGGSLWLHLYDTPRSAPVMTPATLRMSWPMAALQVREVLPRRPIQLHNGGVLVLASSPVDPNFTGDPFWAHWATRPFVNMEPWRQPLALS